MSAIRSLVLLVPLAVGAVPLSQPTAAAADEASSFPQPVADWIQQARTDCPGGFADRGAVHEADLTGDGRTGYLADPHLLSCAGSPHLFGGTGPASIELFVTAPSGAVVHTGGVLALGYHIEPAPSGPPTIVFDTHDIKDETGSFDAYRWDGHNFAMVDHKSMAAPPVQ